jgi:hypothetical protein
MEKFASLTFCDCYLKCSSSGLLFVQVPLLTHIVSFVQGREYLDWDYYHSTLNTYEKDLEYVQYCEALANKTKVHGRFYPNGNVWSYILFYPKVHGHFYPKS